MNRAPDPALKESLTYQVISSTKDGAGGGGTGLQSSGIAGSEVTACPPVGRRKGLDGAGILFTILFFVVAVFIAYAYGTSMTSEKAYTLFDSGFSSGAFCQKQAQDTFAETSDIAKAVEAVQSCREQSGLRRNEFG